jgi:trehalose 6-phosphate phosphatase
MTRRLWMFDFDGTLSPIVPDRRAARILPQARDLLWGLASTPGELVAVLSSRLLDDLIPRVEVPGVYLGGGSGVEWFLSGGKRWTAVGMAERLPEARETLIPAFGNLLSIPGVMLEDKVWSMAVHLRGVRSDQRARVSSLLKDRLRRQGIRFFRGPEVVEIQFLPEVDKVFGVKTICELLGVDPLGDRLIYAGDDENDAVAMAWVIQQGGLAVKVGYSHIVPGAWHVKNPAALAFELGNLIGSNGMNDAGARRYNQ